MSSFTDEAHIAILNKMTRGRVNVRVLKYFEYYSDHFGTRFTVKVPVGFVSDLASTPQWSWSLGFPPLGIYAHAAIVHDFLIKNYELPRKDIDAIFYEAMLVLGEKKWKAWVMYKAVRLNSIWKGYK